MSLFDIFQDKNDNTFNYEKAQNRYTKLREKCTDKEQIRETLDRAYAIISSETLRNEYRVHGEKHPNMEGIDCAILLELTNETYSTDQRQPQTLTTDSFQKEIDKIWEHRIRHRPNRAPEIKVKTTWKGFAVIRPRWEKIEVALASEENKAKLRIYLLDLQNKAPRSFNNVISKFPMISQVLAN